MMISKRLDKSLSTLIKEADTVFSEFVRLSNSNGNGYLDCFVTGDRLHWKYADAAHFIDRRHMATRYDLMNIHPTTIFSNRFDEFHKFNYRQKMFEVYGVQQVYALEAKSKQLTKFTRSELLELIDTYKLKLKELK